MSARVCVCVCVCVLCVCVCVRACVRNGMVLITFHADLPVVEDPEQGRLGLLVSEDAQQDAGQLGAVLATDVGQRVDHVEVLLQDELQGQGDT